MDCSQRARLSLSQPMMATVRRGSCWNGLRVDGRAVVVKMVGSGEERCGDDCRF